MSFASSSLLHDEDSFSTGSSTAATKTARDYNSKVLRQPNRSAADAISGSTSAATFDETTSQSASLCGQAAAHLPPPPTQLQGAGGSLYELVDLTTEPALDPHLRESGAAVYVPAHLIGSVAQNIDAAWRAKWDQKKQRFFFVNLADKAAKSWKLPEVSRPPPRALPAASVPVMPPPSLAAVNAAASVCASTPTLVRGDAVAAAPASVMVVSPLVAEVAMEQLRLQDEENLTRFGILQEQLTRWAALRQHLDAFTAQLRILEQSSLLEAAGDRVKSQVEHDLDQLATAFVKELALRRERQEQCRRERQSLEQREANRRASVQDDAELVRTTLVKDAVIGWARMCDDLLAQLRDAEEGARDRCVAAELIARQDLRVAYRALQRQSFRLFLHNFQLDETETRQRIALAEVQSRLDVNRRWHALTTLREEDMQRRLQDRQRLARELAETTLYESQCREQVRRTERAERVKVEVFSGKDRLVARLREEAGATQRNVQLRAAAASYDGDDAAANSLADDGSLLPGSCSRSSSPTLDAALQAGLPPGPAKGRICAMHSAVRLRSLADECFAQRHEMFADCVAGLKRIYQRFATAIGALQRELTYAEIRAAKRGQQVDRDPAQQQRHAHELQIIERLRTAEQGAAQRRQSLGQLVSQGRRVKEWSADGAELEPYGGARPLQLEWSREAIRRAAEDNKGADDEQLSESERVRHGHATSAQCMSRFVLRCQASLWQPMCTPPLPPDVRFDAEKGAAASYNAIVLGAQDDLKRLQSTLLERLHAVPAAAIEADLRPAAREPLKADVGLQSRTAVFSPDLLLSAAPRQNCSPAPLLRTLRALDTAVSGPESDLAWDECGSRGVVVTGGGLCVTSVVNPGAPLIDGSGGLHEAFSIGTLGIANGQFAWEVVVRVAPPPSQRHRTASSAAPQPLLFVGMASRHFKGRASRCPAYLLGSDGSVTCAADCTDRMPFATRLPCACSVTVHLNMVARELRFFVDGRDQGAAFRFARAQRPEPLFPVILFSAEGQSASLRTPSVECLKALVVDAAVVAPAPRW